MRLAFAIVFETLIIWAGFSLLISSPVNAHMPWLASDSDGHAILWFGESPGNRTYHLPDAIQNIKLMSQPITIEAGADPKMMAALGTAALETKTVDTDDLVGLRSNAKLDLDHEVAGSVCYGLYRGMKLTYHVEHLPTHDTSTWPSQARPGAALQTVITQLPSGGVSVMVLRDQSPVKDVEVKLYCEEGHEEDSQETDIAGIVTFAADKVEDGLNAVTVGLSNTKATGEYEGETYTGEANYLTATFFAKEATLSAAATSTTKKTFVRKNTKPTVDPNSKVSVGPSGLPDLPEKLTSFGATIADEKIYVYGGHTGQAHSYSTAGQSDRLWCLDLNDEGATWQKLTNGPRLQGLALVAYQGKLIRIGGFTAMNEAGKDHDLRSQASVARFDPQTGAWSDLPSLPEPRSSFDAVVLNDLVYVFGGWRLDGGSDDSKWHQTAWSLNLADANATWQPVSQPPFQRRAVSVAAHEGKLYVHGGMQSEGGPTTKVAVYDPAKDQWAEGPALPGKGMSGFGSAAFACGGGLYVSVLDGFVHRLNEDGKDWTTVTKSENARFFHRMLPVDGTRLLMIGGANMEVGKFTQIDAIHLGTVTK